MDEILKAIDEINQRASAATDGPCEVIRFDSDGGAINYQVETHTGEKHVILGWHSDLDNPKAKKDAEFDAHSRTDIPRLTKALRLAVEELEFIKSGCLVPPDGGQPKLEDAIKTASDALAEIEKVLK